MSIIERFPLLKCKVKDLSPQEKDELLARLNQESEDMLQSFARLVGRTVSYLIKHGVTTLELKAFFTHFEMVDLAESIESNDAIPEVMIKVKQGKYWNFFNYELLENMIRCYCKENDQSIIVDLQKYISDFKNYCERRLSEVPAGVLTVNLAGITSKSFKIKLDEMFAIDSKLAVFKRVQYNIQKVLKMQPLFLVDVQSGCVELTFRYFGSKLTITDNQKHDLAAIGVKRVCYDEHELQLLKTPELVKEISSNNKYY